MPKPTIFPTLPQLRPRLCALFITALLVMEPILPLHAQLVAAPPKGLQIVILDGEGALNNIRDRTAREPIVQVQDENHKPVAGALVLFTIHGGSQGASATFANGLTTLQVTTDAEGKAVAHGMQANQSSGAFQIAVTASVGKLSASMVVNEINVVPAPPAPPPVQNTFAVVHAPWYLSKPVMIVGGAIVAGSVATAVALTVDRGTTINLGPGSVGAPQARAGIRFTFGKH
jgi:hypothetical protein